MKKQLRIAVTGSNGQLGNEFRFLAPRFPQWEFHFFTKTEWDIAIESLNEDRLNTLKPDAVINAAAYTNVERAEDERENAMMANGHGPGYLAHACKKHGALLIHISTDYVFDGSKREAYSEDDDVHPLNVYGESKLAGERTIDSESNRYFILRTSWLYGTFGHNFYKTMKRLAIEKGRLTVVSDQIASPTYSRLLAEDILQLIQLKLIEHKPIEYGIYHYTQSGEASWFDFANEIVNVNHLNVPVEAVSSERFPTKAKRPMYSKLSTERWVKNTGIQLHTWQEGVQRCANDERNQGDI
jgi:dTDP-4-dehydrorhamnose reductase